MHTTGGSLTQDSYSGCGCFYIFFVCYTKFSFSFQQLQYMEQHLVRLLLIIIDGGCDMAVRQVASIHFKNFVAKNWSPHEPGMDEDFHVRTYKT